MRCELCHKSIKGRMPEIAVCWLCQSVPTSKPLRDLLSRKADELLQVTGKSRRVSPNSIAATKLRLPLGPTQAPTLTAAQAAWFEKRELQRNELRTVAETNGSAYKVTKRGRKTSLQIGPASLPTLEDGSWDGFHSEHAVTNGLRVGRQTKGVTCPNEIAAIVAVLQPVYACEELATAATQRGPRNGSLPKIKELSRILIGCRERRVNVQALANHFGIRRDRVYALTSERP